jgi:hypothetical protein
VKFEYSGDYYPPAPIVEATFITATESRSAGPFHALVDSGADGTINWRTKDILLGECKWEQGKSGRRVLQTLLEKTDKVVPGRAEWNIHYALFSRRGFSPATERLAAIHDAFLVSLQRMEEDLRQSLGGKDG